MEPVVQSRIGKELAVKSRWRTGTQQRLGGGGRSHGGGWAVAAVLVGAQLCPCSATHAAQLASSPRGQEIVVDGDSREWADIPLYQLGASVQVLGIAHDDHNLFLMFRFTDQRLAARVLYRGMVFWLDGNGRKQADSGVRYSGSQELAAHLQKHSSSISEAAAADPPPEPGGLRVHTPRQQPGEVTIIVNGTKESGSEASLRGVVAASALTDGTFAYEIEVPLAVIGGAVADTAADHERKLRVGVQLGGLTRAEREFQENLWETGQLAAAGMLGGSSGGPGAAGMPGAVGLGTRSGRFRKRSVLEDKTIWLTVVLPPTR